MAHISACPPLVRGSVIQAHTLIRPYIHRTPVLTSRTLDQLASTPQELLLLTNPQPASPVIRLFFKCENQQVIGAFKARGAFHAIERLKQEPGWQENGGQEKGVVAFSAGMSLDGLQPPRNISLSWTTSLLISRIRQSCSSYRHCWSRQRNAGSHCDAQYLARKQNSIHKELWG